MFETMKAMISYQLKSIAVFFQSQARINESIKRVAKKKFKEDPTAGEKFISEAVGRLSIATKADDVLKTADLVVEAVSCISFYKTRPEFYGFDPIHVQFYNFMLMQ